jgi:hypothetical protein
MPIRKCKKIEKELIVTINNLPQTEVKNKKLKKLKVSKVKSKRTVKVTKNMYHKKDDTLN